MHIHKHSHLGRCSQSTVLSLVNILYFFVKSVVKKITCVYYNQQVGYRAKLIAIIKYSYYSNSYPSFPSSQFPVTSL